MGQFHDDAERYLELMRREVPAYDALHDALARQTLGPEVRRVMDLASRPHEPWRPPRFAS